jgi:hypothetical protein
MAEAEIEVVGVYKIVPDEEAFEDAMTCTGDENEARAVLDSIVLIECAVSNADERFQIDDFGQEGSDQAPYDEVYFDDANKIIARAFDRPAAASFRVCFYLHFFDPTKRLTTPYGVRPLPPVEPFPTRLSVFGKYEFYD